MEFIGAFIGAIIVLCIVAPIVTGSYLLTVLMLRTAKRVRQTTSHTQAIPVHGKRSRH